MEKLKATKKVAPDGGWGWTATFGVSLVNLATRSIEPSFGLLFGDILTGLNVGTTGAAIIISALDVMMNFSGLFVGPLLKEFSYRKVAIAGSLLCAIGLALTSPAQSMGHILATYSVINGIGVGLATSAAFVALNHYFSKKRGQAVGLSMAGTAMGMLIMPQLVRILLEEYAFRGAVLLLAGLALHAAVGSTLLQPIKWHLVDEEIDVEMDIGEYPALGAIIEDDGDEDSLPEIQTLLFNTKKHDRERKISETNSNGGGLVIPNVQSSDEINDDINKKPYRDTVNPINPQQGLCLARSNHSISSRRTSIIKEVSNLTEIRTNWQIVVDFLDLTLLKNPVYVNIVVGISLAHYSDVAFFTFQPMYLFLLGYTKSETAYIISIGAAADLLSRIFLAASSACIKVKARYVYLAGALFTVVSRFAFLCVFDFTGMAVITAVMGFLRTWIHVPLPLIFAEILTQERFPSGYGLFMFLQGNIMFIIGPVIGYLRDITGSYTIAFHSLAFVMAAGCVIPWFYEVCYYKFYKKTQAPVVE
ncbi:unnamed protein product [Diamesa hyperborea]